MSDEVSRLENMCSHCRVKSARRRYTGTIYKYCSLECDAIEHYRNYAVLSCFFGFMFIAIIYELYRFIFENAPLPTDIFSWLMVAFVIPFFPILAYASVIGYRGARRERREAAGLDKKEV